MTDQSDATRFPRYAPAPLADAAASVDLGDLLGAIPTVVRGRFRFAPRALVLAVTAAISLFAGAKLGWYPLLAIGIGIGCLLGLAVAQVVLIGVTGWRFEWALSPATPAVRDQIEVAVRGTPRRWWSPSLRFVDDGRFGEHHALFAGGRHESVAASWTITADQRGEMEVGPGELWRIDVMGLVRRRCGRVEATTVVVRPQSVVLDRVALLRRSRLDGAIAPRERATEPGDARPYVPGDDPRRVNWKASARTRARGGELMVSDDECRQPDDELLVVVELDGLPGPRSPRVDAPVPAARPQPDRELALSTTASILRAFSGTRHCSLEIRRGGKALHRGSDLDDNLEALALVEQLDANATAPLGRGHHGSLRARQQRPTSIVVTGPAGGGEGRLRIMCDTNRTAVDTKSSADRDVVVVDSLATLAATFAAEPDEATRRSRAGRRRVAVDPLLDSRVDSVGNVGGAGETGGTGEDHEDLTDAGARP